MPPNHPNTNPKPKPSSQKPDFILRGTYGPSPLATTLHLFITLLDALLLQRALQVLNPLPALFTHFNLPSPPPPPRGGTALASSSHDLTPFQALIWLLPILTALKQVYYTLYLSREKLALAPAIIFPLINAVLNSACTLSFSLASVNPTWSTASFWLCIFLFGVGLGIETVSETQRKWFKANPKTEGKLFMRGLFAWARSVNYFGFALGRGAQAGVCAGPVLGLVVGGFFGWDFVNRAIPGLERYCVDKYGRGKVEEWRRRVRFVLVPGVY